jgi:two-component system, NtrC family, response regulator AlgB
MLDQEHVHGLRVLVVDDEKHIRSNLSLYLESMSCTVAAVADAEGALAAAARSHFDLAFLDLRLGQDSGIDLIPKLLAERPDLAIVIITAHASFDSAVDAIRRGAVDYLPKPFTTAQIRHLVERIAENASIRRRVRHLEERLAELVPEADLEPTSGAMRAALDLAGRVAASQAPVLLRGESGTGKGVLALTIHAQSPRQGRPFVTINCPTLSKDLLTSELFGHVEGAFTGATRDRSGRVEAAEGGTLFLDEIGEIAPGLQAKLLRFLQTKEFERVGENRTRRADVRIMAATSRDLEEEVRSGHFRQDLFYRLNVVEITLPPLRDRDEDVLRLANHYLAFFAHESGRPAPQLSPAAEQTIRRYAWPGNLRELRNTMERAVIVWPAQVIEPEAFPERVLGRTAGGLGVGGDCTLEDLEREHILRVLARVPAVEEAARILGIDASTLWRKRKKYTEPGS